MRGPTWSQYDEPENSGFFPLTLALSPRGKRVQLEKQLRMGSQRKLKSTPLGLVPADQGLATNDVKPEEAAPHPTSQAVDLVRFTNPKRQRGKHFTRKGRRNLFASLALRVGRTH